MRILFFLTFLFVLMFPATSFADIRDYGEGKDNFHKDNFVIKLDDNAEGGTVGVSNGGIGNIDAYGYYDGLIDPEDESENFMVKYHMNFSPEDIVRINKGDVSVKVIMDVADTTSGSNDTAKFDLYAYTNGAWQLIDHKHAETSSTTWSFNKAIPAGTTILELKFFSEDNLDNSVEFTNVNVYFYDGGQPDITEIVSSDTGTKKIGDITYFQVKFNEAVNVAGTPRIKMSTGGYAYYYSGSGTSTLTFKYTVAEGQQVDRLNYSTSPALIELSGGTIRDRGPNNALLSFVNKTNNLVNKNIKIDGKKPVISSISTAITNNKLDSSSQPIKQLNGGDSVTLTVNFDEPVNVTGTAGSIQLKLNNGSYAIAQSTGSNISSLVFKYNVTSADNDVAVLDVTEFLGGTVRDLAGNDLVRTVKSIATAGIRIDKTAPAAGFSENQNTAYSKRQDAVVTISDSGSGLSGQIYKYYWSQNSSISSVTWSSVPSGNQNQCVDIKTIALEGVTGKYYLHVRSEDVAGNIGYNTSGVFYLDNQGPAVSFSPASSTSPKADYNVKVIVSDALSAIDTGSIEYQWYKGALDVNRWNPLTVSGGIAYINAVGKGVNNNIDGHGKWKLAIRGRDSVGNVNTISSGEFFIDKAAPVIEITSDYNSGDFRKNHTGSINAMDPNYYIQDYVNGIVSGIWYQWTDNEITPDLNGSGWLPYYGAFSQGSFNGLKWLHVKAQDNSGNKSAKHQLFKFDNQAPSIVFVTNGLEIVRGSVTASISLSDEFSGISGWYYQWSQDGVIVQENWKPTASYSLPLSNADGDWYLSIKAVDNSGNEGTATSKRFRLDNMPPTGTIDIIEEITSTNTVDISLSASDTNYTDELQYRLSTDNGVTWSLWGNFVSRLENFSIPDVSGSRKVQVQYRDKFSNTGIVYEDTVILDKTPPTAEMQYSIMDRWVSGDVAAVLGNIKDSYMEGDAVIYRDPLEVSLLSANEGIVHDQANNEYSYLFRNNGRLDFTIMDKAGNKTVISALVNWIDKSGPEISFAANGNSNASMTAGTSVNITDTVQFEGAALKTELPDSYYYQWSKNTVSPGLYDTGWQPAVRGEQINISDTDGEWYLHVKASDSLGNTTILRSNKYVLDNTPPNPTISYSNTNRTANPVTAYIEFDEPAAVTNTPGGSSYYTFSDNGSFTFMYEDRSGNTGAAEASVNWIDKNLPHAAVIYSATDWTKDNVTVTMAVYGEPRRELKDFNLPEDLDYEFLFSDFESDGTVVKAVYELRENGSFSFVVRDCVTGNYDTVNIVVNNIDKIPPQGEAIYSKTQKTRDNIEVTILTSDNTNQGVEVISPEGAVLKEANGNTYIVSQNGEYDFILRDVSGNEAVLTAVIGNIDRDAPQGAIVYTPDAWTKDTVTATVSANEEIQVMNNDGNREYTFYQNGSFTFTLRDTAGNTSEVTAEVDWIDKTSPTGVLRYDAANKTNKGVEIIVGASDNSNAAVQVIHPEGMAVKVPNTSYIAADNGNYTFKLVDAAGNEGTLTAAVNNIDKLPPTAEVGYSTTEITNENVEIRLTLSEEAEVTAPEKILVKEKDGFILYEAPDNGDYIFILTDPAQNENTVTASVYNIDRLAPAGRVSYSTLEITRDPVIATVQADEEFTVMNNFNLKERVFFGNGAFTFQLMDTAGNWSEVKAEVGNIDNIPPVVSVTYSTVDYTNKNVTATVTSNEDIIVLNNNGSRTFEFKENGTFKFRVSDMLGNETTAYATVNNIDKVSPVITFNLENRLVLKINEKHELNDFTAYDPVDGERTDMTEKVLIDKRGLDITRAGQYQVSYSVTDRAGNTTAVNRNVAVISPDAYRVFINGLDTQLDSMAFDTPQLNISVMNSQGEVEVRWKQGYLSQGDMKSMANILGKTEGYVFNAPATGYYTFYIQDQERNAELIRIFIKSIGNKGVQ